MTHSHLPLLLASLLLITGDMKTNRQKSQPQPQNVGLWIRWIKRGSVARKVNAAIFLLILPLLLLNFYSIYQDEKSDILNHFIEKANILNEAYFDSLNSLMLTEEMDARQTHPKKVLLNPNVLEARVIRGDAVKAQFGEGLASEQPVDDIDRLALSGEKVVRFINTDDQHELIVATPYRLSTSTRGVNCLACHKAPSDSIAGVVRISFSTANANKEINNHLWKLVSSNAAILIIALFFLAFYLNRVVTSGLKESAEVAAEIASGNFAVEFPEIRKDDMGRLMWSLRDMRDSLQQMFAERKEREEREIQQLEEELAEKERALHQFTMLENGLVHVMHGLNNASVSIQGVTEKLSSTTSCMKQNSDAAEDEARRVVDQVTGTTDSTQQIAQAFDEINQNSQGVIEIAGHAATDAKKTTVRMHALSKASDDISSVIATITAIADKTNMLALNASIEASRAGDAGRGFAVVANEVKALALQTAQATQAVTAQIDEMQAECRDAVEATNNISLIIENMNKQTHEVEKILEHHNAAVHGIASNAGEVNRSMQQVGRTVSEVNQSARETDMIAGDMSSYSMQLNNISEEQSQLITQILRILKTDLEKDGDNLNTQELSQSEDNIELF